MYGTSGNLGFRFSSSENGGGGGGGGGLDPHGPSPGSATALQMFNTRLINLIKLLSSLASHAYFFLRGEGQKYVW